jgi:hypothetical protein
MFMRKHIVDNATPVTTSDFDLPPFGRDLVDVDEALRGILCAVSSRPDRNGL